MNAIFLTICLVSIYLLALADPTAVMPSMLSGIEGSVTLSLKLLGIYAIWLSVLKIFEQAGVSAFLTRSLKKITTRLFKGETEETYGYLTMNLSANILGMGGAATPMGIKSVETMKKHKNKVMLVVINATSIQLVPTTIMSLAATHGAIKDIFLPSLLSTILTSAVGILLVKILVKDK